MPLTPDELGQFITTIDQLTREMRVHEQLLETTNKRSRWAQKVAIIGVGVGLTGLAVGIGGIIFGVAAQATADDLAESRRESQVSACIQANETTERTRDALIAGVSVLTQPDARRTDAQQASVDRFVVEYTRHVDGALPFRDCSRRGIDAYYANPPVDPALGGATTTSTVVTR